MIYDAFLTKYKDDHLIIWTICCQGTASDQTTHVESIEGMIHLETNLYMFYDLILFGKGESYERNTGVTLLQSVSGIF